MASALTYYDPTYDAWPDLRLGRIVLAPVRNDMDRRTGRMINGWHAVVQSLEMIFKTRFHERILRRWVGSFVPHLLGESDTDRTITRFYWAIMVSIELWEPNYRVTRVRVDQTADANGQPLTSPEELRMGHLSTVNEGVYRPRAHLGDPTPETRRNFGLIGIGPSLWEATPL
jgi:phage baseplate assembly protein W